MPSGALFRDSDKFRAAYLNLKSLIFSLFRYRTVVGKSISIYQENRKIGISQTENFEKTTMGSFMQIAKVLLLI